MLTIHAASAVDSTGGWESILLFTRLWWDTTFFRAHRWGRSIRVAEELLRPIVMYVPLVYVLCRRATLTSYRGLTSLPDKITQWMKKRKCQG